MGRVPAQHAQPVKLLYLPGQEAKCGDDDGLGEPIKDHIAAWEWHVTRLKLPVVEGAKVVSVTRATASAAAAAAAAADEDLLLVKVEGNHHPSYVTRNVVGATGPFQFSRVPEMAADLAADVAQLTADSFRNEARLPEGAVLVVGSGQCGVQITEELALAGRRVYLATTPHPACPRSHRGRDMFVWMEDLGMINMPKTAFPNGPLRSPQPFIGPDHAISYHSLARLGVTLGRIEGFSGGDGGTTATFRANLPENLAAAQESHEAIRGMIERIRRKIEAGELREEDLAPVEPDPAWEPHEPLLDAAVSAPTSLDLRQHGITSVLWCTGWGADFSWMRLTDEPREALGGQAYPEDVRGPHPGMWWLGFPWLRHRASALICGFEEDAKHLVTSRSCDDL